MRAMQMNDPTYVKDEINARPEWRLAFWISELVNDDAPIGWNQYTYLAKRLIEKFGLDVDKLGG